MRRAFRAPRVQEETRAMRRAKKTLASLIFGATVIAGVTVATPAVAADAPQAASFTVDGNDIKSAAANVNGLTFKGFGVLSGNSSGALLMDYKAEHPAEYWQLIKVLFGGRNPIMNTVKIEMGNDRNTSTGPEPATMRSSDEYPDVQREPGFQLAADAKKVDPKLHVSILRWRSPAWVQGNDDVYKWFKNTILAVYRAYGYMVDSVDPGVNESAPDLNWTKDFSHRIKTDDTGFISSDSAKAGFKSDKEASLFHQIKTIISDEAGVGTFGNAITSDAALRQAADVAGYHYSTQDDADGNFTKLADQYDKEVWNSEAQATMSNSADRPNSNNEGASSGVGGAFGSLEMANTAIKGFVNSRRTNFIYQPAIGSFYEGEQYSSKEVVSARDPWSGWMYYDAAVSVLEQFSQFAKTGWENSTNTAGIWRAIPQASASAVGGTNPVNGARNGEVSYLTLADPKARDFSSIVVNDSKYTKQYTINTKNLDLGNDRTMEIWETRAADPNSGEAYDANYRKFREEIQPNSAGAYTVTVAPWSMVTATTLDKHGAAKDGALNRDVPRTPEASRAVLDTNATGAKQGVTHDKTLYADDFEYADSKYADLKTLDPATGKLVASGQSYIDSRGGQQGATPRYTSDLNGAFEVYKTPTGNHVLRQQVGPGMANGPFNGGAWNDGDPLTTIGDYRWTNYKVSADVSFEPYDGTAPYASIGAREQGGTANGQNTSAYGIRVTADGAWTLSRFGKTLQTGTFGAEFTKGANATNSLALRVAGATVTALVNGKSFATYTDPVPQTSGRIQLGSSFNFVDFDNLKVERVDGYAPYFADTIDDEHMTSWDDNSDKVLQYNDQWSNRVGGSMYQNLRSTSTSTGKGATLTYRFKGTGLDLLGADDGSATLDVAVDGKPVALNAATQPSGSYGTTYSLRGLSDGEHAVSFQTTNDAPFLIDMVGVSVANSSGKVNTDALRRAVDSANGLKESDYDPKYWAVLQANLDEGRAALAKPQKYGLDQEGADGIASRIAVSEDIMINGPKSTDVRDLGLLAAVTDASQLPASVTIDGQSVAFDQIDWTQDPVASVSAADPAQFERVTLSGITKTRLASGVRQRIAASILVVRDRLAYFIDSGADPAVSGSAYSAVKDRFPALLNSSADETWDGAASGKTWGYSTTSTVRGAGDASDWAATFDGANYGKPITYHLTLPAGTYTIGAVQAPRPGASTNIYATVTGSDGTVLAPRTNVTSAGDATQIVNTITLDADTVVNLEFGTNGTSGYNARLALVWVSEAANSATTS